MSTTKNAPTKPTAGLSGNAHQRRNKRRADKKAQFRARIAEKK